MGGAVLCPAGAPPDTPLAVVEVVAGVVAEPAFAGAGVVAGPVAGAALWVGPAAGTLVAGTAEVCAAGAVGGGGVSVACTGGCEAGGCPTVDAGTVGAVWGAGLAAIAGTEFEGGAAGLVATLGTVGLGPVGVGVGVGVALGIAKLALDVSGACPGALSVAADPCAAKP